MTYIRSPSLNQSLSLHGEPLDSPALTSDRQSLVDQFNAIVGKPGKVIEEMQNDFIQGKMLYDEMVSYLRYCEYMIHTAKVKAI